MIIKRKSAIELSVEMPLPESLQYIPRMNETTYKFLGFEMKHDEVARKEMMKRLEERIHEKVEEPTTRRVEVFEARNWVQNVNQNIMSIIRFYSGRSSSPSGGLTGWT